MNIFDKTREDAKWELGINGGLLYLTDEEKEMYLLGIRNDQVVIPISDEISISNSFSYICPNKHYELWQNNWDITENEKVLYEAIPTWILHKILRRKIKTQKSLIEFYLHNNHSFESLKGVGSESNRFLCAYVEGLRKESH